jgi:hypothetical protein
VLKLKTGGRSCPVEISLAFARWIQTSILVTRRDLRLLGLVMGIIIAIYIISGSVSYS